MRYLRLLTCVASLLFMGAVVPARSLGHPLKLTTSLVEYDPSTAGIRMECKVFIDDFERSLKNSLLKGLDMSRLKPKQKVKVIEAYFGSSYSISVNGKPLPLRFESSEMLAEQNVLVLKFAKNKVRLKKGDTLVIRNALFFRDFGERQTNRVTVRIPPFIDNESRVATVHGFSLNYTL